MWISTDASFGIVYEVLSNTVDRVAANLDSATATPPGPSNSGPRRKFSKSSINDPATPVGPDLAPIFNSTPLHEFRGHTSDILDVSWSNGGFLISASMDKTCRLWFVSLSNPKSNCLSVFPHLDFVTNVDFHPLDDRFFLSSSLDRKLRLWSIPLQRVDVWSELPELLSCCESRFDFSFFVLLLLSNVADVLTM